MLKFIRGKSQQPSAERQKLQKELFAFRKTVQHGFPNKPSSLAWDPELRLAAIATTSGAIKVFGKPGVEFYGHLSSCEHSVMKMGFIPNQGYLVLLSDDNSLHLWEINDAALVEINSFTMEGRLKRLSTFTVEAAKENIILGTEGGNVYFLNIEAFKTCENIDCGSSIIYQDIVMQNIPEKYKFNPGAVEILEEQPNNKEVLLIGYNRGLVVLWNRETCVALQTYVHSQHLESLCWHPSGTKFVTVHNDGSMVVWGSDKCDSPLEDAISFYGPFPCKAITKILWRKATDMEHDNFVIFCGGMPRATYGDHHCLTVQRGTKKLVCFDFTSKIIDFFTIDSTGNGEYKGPEALIVLVEEELVAIDLKSDDWKVIELPYLYSLHASSITFTNFVSNVEEKLWKDLTELGRAQREGQFSPIEWPINGGVVAAQAPNPARKSLLITGHEDGSVRFWDAGSCCLFPLYWFKTSTIFSSEDDFYEDDQGDVTTDDEGEGWPPFKKVGCFDPYSDDPRLAIKKVCLCPISGDLAIAGAGGQVIICEVRREPVTDKTVKVHVLNLVSDRDSFAWKGHERLYVKGSTKQDPNTAKFSVDGGYQTNAIIQVFPPASVTALVLQAEWGLVSIGTAHGVMLFDYIREAPVFVKCTLTSNESGVNEPPISRTKSFKKSLRESFRRLRKGRSSRHPDRRSSGTSNVAKSPAPVSPNAPEPRRRIIGNDLQSAGSATTGSSIDARPVERAVEARPADDPLGSMVRCLYFAAHSYIVNIHNPIPTLWAGTNSGTVYIFTINIPSATKRKEEKVTAQLGKEIQLKHRAPVIGICVIDGSNRPLPEAYEVEKKLCKPVDYSSPHHVIIGSEEQFKIFSLPHLRATGKLKLTATEGARVRRMNLALFSTAHHLEYCLLCLTNLGECLVLSVPDLRKQIMAAVIRREDINGISTLTFSRYGEGLYLQSSSEIQRFSLSTSRITKPHCTLNLPVKPIRQTSSSISSQSEEISTPLSTPTTVAHCTITEESEDPEPFSDAKSSGNASKTESAANTSQNRMSSVSDDEGFHDVSAITIDSVKEHFTNLSTNETTTTTTQVVHKILKEQVTIKTSSVNNNIMNETPPSVSSATITTNETSVPKHTTTSV